MNTNFEGNSPYQEGVISESYQRLEKYYIQEPLKMSNMVDTDRLIQKFLSKQRDIHKILEIIQRKILKGTHLPIIVKEIQAGYLTSQYFKDLYLYLAQNKLPSRKSAICKIEALVEKCILLDSLLFKLVTMPDKESALLAIPEICADKPITLYVYSLRVATYFNSLGKINLQHYSYRLEFT